MQANHIRNDVDVGIIFPRWHCYHTSSFLSSSASSDNDGRDNNSSSTTDCKKVDDASGESKSNGRGINDERKDYESESNNKNNKNKNNNNSNNNRNGKISGNDANDHDHDGMEPRFQDTELPTHSFFGATSTSSVAPGDGGGGNIDDDVLGDRGAEKKKPPPAHPSVSKMLSLLYPEAKSLLVALGFLTIATSATMQFPNAIGQIVDILSSSSSSEVIDAVVAAASSSSTETATGGGGGGADGGGVDAIVGGGAVASSAAAGDLPLAHQHLAQHVLLQEQIQTIGLQLTSFFAMGALGTFASSAIFDSTGERIGADLRKRLFANLIRRDLNFFANNRSGELANRLSTDVHEVVEHLVHNMAYFLYNVIRALTAVASMAIISPSLTACISVPMPVLLGGCAMYYGGHIRHWTGRQLDVLARSTHVATERFGGISTVLSFGQRRAEERRYSDVIEASYGYARRVAIYEGAFWGSSYLVGHAALMIVLMLGSHQVLGGEISPGHLAGFCMYAIHLTDAVVELSQATGGFLRAQGSGARLFDLLEGRDDHVGGTADSTDATTAVEDGGDDGIDRDLAPLVTNAAATLPSSYDSTVRFEGVEFSYPSHRNKSILGKTSFTLQNGEMLAITGLSGSGKSSIVSLLMRFYEPSAGRITLGGSDVRRLDVDWLRSQVGLVGQEPILFHASVYENVSYGRPDATRDEVVEACMAAGAHRFVLELPDQYDTIVGGRGANISGGQKQRLCIARALLTKPRILALGK
jgi:ABC-type multidrug transport system fused ATPase/permease subunit